MELPTTYAYSRSWALQEDHDFSRYLALQGNWEKTATFVPLLRGALEDGLQGVAGIRCVAAAGSVGRMEASTQSDADLIIVLRDDVDPQSSEGKGIYEQVWAALEGAGFGDSEESRLDRPNPQGVFAEPCTTKQLIGPDVGSASEPRSVTAKRLLLLLESQPILGEPEYGKLMQEIVSRYAADYVASDPRKEWTFLLNDLIKYFRALCVHYQWEFKHDNSRWPLRNLKLRHSRLIMYGGLLSLLGEASTQRREKVDWLHSRLCLTPLERIGWVYGLNRDWCFHRIMGLYNVFMGRLNEEDFRLALEGEYEERFANSLYADLKANSDGLVAELLRFVLSRRGCWSERFFEYLVF